MADSLEAARTLAEKLRFSGDTLRPSSNEARDWFTPALNSSYINELRICPEVTPDLAVRLFDVCERLLIPHNALHAFVFPSSDIQAECFASTAKECIVRFSSALIDILDEDEFQFVAGHEIGHFLLRHGLTRAETPSGTLEYYMQSRYQEVSVDRVGLFGCGSINVATSAMMKTLSGLTSRHLRNDVTAFLSQLGKAKSAQSMATASHPSILVRCRALLWFSMACELTPQGVANAAREIRSIDERVMSDLDKFVDRDAKEIINRAKIDLSMWMAALRIVQTGSFSKAEQHKISDRFGTDTLEKLKAYLSGLPADTAEEIVLGRVAKARTALERLIPEALPYEVQRLRDELDT